MSTQDDKTPATKEECEAAFARMRRGLLKNATPTERIASAFTEWERRFRDEPAKFISDYEQFRMTTTGYGESAGAYFESILRDLYPVES